MRSHTSNAAQNSGGELPLLGLHQSSARTSGTSYGRAQIVGSWRAKCSSSRSLYYADGYEELEASSRHDVRRSASTLYRTDVDSEYFERLQLPARRSRLHANNNSRISRLSKQPATSCSTSSPQLTRDALTPLRVESARGRIAGWSLPISSTELPAAATRDQEISCPGSRNKQEEQQQQADEEDHDRETEEQQLEEEEEEEEAGKKKNYVWKKNVHEIVCQSCGMEVAVSEAFVNLESKQQQQLRRRRRSSRVATMGGGPDQRGDENSSLVEESESSLKFASCEDGIEDLQPRDDEKRSAAAPPSPASWKPAAGGSARAASQSLEEIYMTPATSCEQDRSAAVPFKWEDAPGKPKTTTTTTTTQKAKARCRLSREQGFEFNSFVEEAEIVLSRSAATASATVLTTDQQGSGSSRQESGSCELKSTRSLRDQTRAAVGERSHRYYGDQVAAAAAVHRREKSLQEKETTTHIIDLVAPAAAKFLVQETSCYLSPVATPLHHRASFASPGAVPFKWEETPGKPKADAEEASSKPHSLLQLPPRLAIPQQQRASDIGSNSSSSFFSARDLCAHYLPNYSSLSGPLVGFFSPCLTSACNAQARPRQHAVHHSSFSPSSSSSSPSSSYKLGSKSLPRKLSPSSSPPPVNSPALRKRSAFSAPLASSSSPTGGLQPRICYSSEELLKAAAASYSSSHPCKNNVVGGEGGGRRRRRYAEAPSPHPAAGTVMMNSSSSTPSSSIFHDRPEAESLSQTSGSNPASSSGYFLDALTRPTSCCTPFGASSSSLHVRSKSSGSSSSSQASYESVEQEFDQEEEEQGGEHAAATRSPTSYSSSSRRHHRLPPLDSRCCDQNSLGGGSSAAAAASAGMKALIIKLCRNGNCFNSCSSSEEARAPSTLLATYFHNCMEVNQNSTLSSELDEHKRSSRSSAAVAAATATTAVASPIPLTRLPYTMPSVAEQELAARQLQHKPPPPPNPDFAARLGDATTITKLIPPLQTAAKTCNPAAATMMSAQCEKTLQLRQLSCNNATHYSVNCCCFRDDEVSSASPAYATALEMLSPAMNFMPQQSRCKSSTTAFVAASSSSARTRKTTSSTTCRWTGPKVRHRVRFIFSMCKALKRVLFKQRHRKVVVEPNFWYHDEIPLTEFQFVKPTEY